MAQATSGGRGRLRPRHRASSVGSRSRSTRRNSSAGRVRSRSSRAWGLTRTRLVHRNPSRSSSSTALHTDPICRQTMLSTTASTTGRVSARCRSPKSW